MNDIIKLFSLDGKTAIVTGANTGLGQGISIALAGAGAKVFGVARRSCNETLEKIKKFGGDFTEVIADLSEISSIEKKKTAVIKDLIDKIENYYEIKNNSTYDTLIKELKEYDYNGILTELNLINDSAMTQYIKDIICQIKDIME